MTGDWRKWHNDGIQEL